MKFQISFLVIFSVVASLEGWTMSFGHLRPRNLVLYDQLFHHRIDSDGETCKNLEFSSRNGYLITAIHITDLTLSQDGGYVEILCGGIGYNFVKLLLNAENSRQILLNVEIFGSFDGF